MKKQKNNGVFSAIRDAAAAQPFLTVGTLLCVAASVGAHRSSRRCCSGAPSTN